MATKISAALTLTGKNIDHPNLTETVGLEPTKKWKEGDQILESKLKYKHDGWSVETEIIETIDLQVPIKQLFDKINPFFEKLRETIKSLNLDSEIQCVVYADEQELPALYLEKEIIKIIHELDASLDIDLYLI